MSNLKPTRLPRRPPRPDARCVRLGAANDPVWVLAPTQRSVPIERRLPAGSGLVLGAFFGAMCWAVLFVAVAHVVR